MKEIRDTQHRRIWITPLRDNMTMISVGREGASPVLVIDRDNLYRLVEFLQEEVETIDKLAP